MYKEEREKERQNIHAMNVTVNDLNRLIKSKAKTLNNEGKINTKAPISANSMSHY
jgi:hypothetical protein